MSRIELQTTLKAFKYAGYIPKYEYLGGTTTSLRKLFIRGNNFKINKEQELKNHDQKIAACKGDIRKYMNLS